MIQTPAVRRFSLRHVQLARAAVAAIAAVIVTFSPDHSASVGLTIFSGFALATGAVLLADAWLVRSTAPRWPAAVLGALAVLAGSIAALAPLHSVTTFFVVLVTWALVTGSIEAFAGARGMRAARGRPKADAARTESRDALTVGILTVVLGLGLLLVPTQYALRYTIDEANATFTLTGITIAVGLFGAYAAIIAVYLAIAGFSPRGETVIDAAPAGSGRAETRTPGSTPLARTDARVPADLGGATATDERGTR